MLPRSLIWSTLIGGMHQGINQMERYERGLTWRYPLSQTPTCLEPLVAWIGVVAIYDQLPIRNMVVPTGSLMERIMYQIVALAKEGILSYFHYLGATE
jgi:hypothetical protein